MVAVGPASVGVRVSLPAVLSTGPSALGHAKEGGPAKAEAWRRRRHHKFSLGFSYFHLFSPSFTSRPQVGTPCIQQNFSSNSRIAPILHSSFCTAITPLSRHSEATAEPLHSAALQQRSIKVNKGQ